MTQDFNPFNSPPWRTLQPASQSFPAESIKHAAFLTARHSIRMQLGGLITKQRRILLWAETVGLCIFEQSALCSFFSSFGTCLMTQHKCCLAFVYSVNTVCNVL